MVEERKEGSTGELWDIFRSFSILAKIGSEINSMFPQAKTLFDEAALDIEEQLIQTSASGLTYIAEMK